MKLEVGKRYNRRDGGVSGVIEFHISNYDVGFDYWCDGISYNAQGAWSACGDDNPRDLISEYIKPSEWQLVTSYDQINRKDVVVSWNDGDPVAFKVVEVESTVDYIWVDAEGTTWVTGRDSDHRKATITVTGDDIKAEWVE